MRLLISLLFASPLAAQIGGFSVVWQDAGLLAADSVQHRPACRAGRRSYGVRGARRSARIGQLGSQAGDRHLSHPGRRFSPGPQLRLPRPAPRPLSSPRSSTSTNPSCRLSSRSPSKFLASRFPPRPASSPASAGPTRPLVAGFRRGAGAVLWVAASPGPQGYERFPLSARRPWLDLGLRAAVPRKPPLGLLRFLLPHARRSGLLRREVAHRRNQRPARRRLAFLRARPRARRLPAPSDRRLPSRRASWSTPGWNCRTSARSSGPIIPSGARKPRSCRTRNSIGASS